MRPSVRSFKAFRASLHLTICLLLTGLVFVLPATAQGTRPAQTVATKKTETGLVFKDMRFRKMTLDDKVYAIGPNARFYALDGKPIKPHQVKAGDKVDIEYLTGIPKTEVWPYLPSERILTVLRIVPKPRQ